MKVDQMEIKMMMAGKQRPRNFHENHIAILQCGYFFLLKDAESKRETKLHADSYANTFISPSSACTSLSVDRAQNN